MESLSIISSKLNVKYNGRVTLDASTFTALYKPARFIDQDYGEWWAWPGYVLCGHGHKLRGREMLRQATIKRHKLQRQRKFDELKSLESLVRKLYFEDKLCCNDISKYFKQNGQKFSRREIGNFIKSTSTLRSITEQNEISKPFEYKKQMITCEICKNQVACRTKRQRWCDICAPDRLSRGYAKKFGISRQQYDDLLKQQNHLCAVCHKDLKIMPSHHVHVDHCHTTNKIRGILCLYCNRGIGCFFNDSESLRSASIYLDKFNLV